MSLPLLVGGSAECGPSANNPLRGLTKNFDKDRGAQQDLLSPNRTGSSNQTFRTHNNPVSSENLKEAANFFSTSSSAPVLHTPSSPFDFANLKNALPTVNHQSLQVSMSFPEMLQRQTQFSSSGTAWASDFMNFQQTQPSSSSKQTIATPPSVVGVQNIQHQSLRNSGSCTWDNFLSALAEESQPLEQVQPVPTQISEEQQQHRVVDSAERDALARTAGQLVEALREEQNPKFKNSQFMGLMRSLADRTSVVEGNNFVSASSVSANTASTSADVKGKGKERADTTTFGQTRQKSNTTITSDVTQDSSDEVYEYFKQENEDYIAYQQTASRVAVSNTRGLWDDSSQQYEWDKFQGEWDAWEANAVGVRKMSNYQFAAENPYLLGSSTRVHDMHSLFDQTNTLELEAAVQRDPKNVQAWYALGVKQQDSEREQKAIEALHRAVELDPEYVPSWLALGVSHTNESNRAKAYGAIREWVKRHPKFLQTVVGMTGGFKDEVFEPGSERSQKGMYERLIACLIEIVRNASGSEEEQGIDPDVQIALAVLLNSNEEYTKATDCFLTALAVRPHDWALYNRVGATLANSGNADSALEYYYRALELNPAYIRARFNLGISCVNLHRYEEAGRHILDALTLQNSDAAGDPRGGVTSDALWNCLESVCDKMGWLDLTGACERRDLDSEYPRMAFVPRLFAGSVADRAHPQGLRMKFETTG
ncbi:TPR-like protein [Thelephora ganbajun]|uniref:TPR-like protein n=1 Tax=Thelephora ganbajun TaxID=370292 RepID=A0ACB6ZVF4_THEGA|nr:TPR-like protein [Thelephora ganbajun]